MNLHIITLSVVVAVVAAHFIPTNRPLPKHSVQNYAKPAELHQSGRELKHGGGFADQSQSYDDGHRSKEGGAKVLSQQLEIDGHGYRSSYETDNGIKAQEQGTYEGKNIAVQGGYSYTGDDGQTYTVTYTADENGFRPSGAHLPTPPPIPEGLMKGLEQNEKDEAAGIYDDGSYKESQQLQGQSLPEAQYQPTYETYQQHNSEQAHQLPITTYQSHATDYQAPASQNHQLPGFLSHTTSEFGHQNHGSSDFGQSHGSSDFTQGSYGHASGYQSQGTGYNGHVSDYQTQGNGYDSQGTGYQSLGNEYQSLGNDYQSLAAGYQSEGTGYQSQGTGDQGHDNGLGHGATVSVSSSVGGEFHYKH